MRAAIAQIDSVIGGFEGNAAKIIEFAHRARDAHADLVLFPELSVCGYPPMDLLDQDNFVELNIRTLRRLQRELPPDIAVGAGYVNRNPSERGKALVNAFGIILGGSLVFEQVKTLLPTYDVFDEARNFEPAHSWNYFEYKNERLGIAICEDVWRETETPGTKYASDPVRALLDRGITLLCVPSASPYYAGKHETRLALARRLSARGDLPLLYITAVGANDSIIFDGRSFFLHDDALETATAFEEDLIVVDVGKGDGGWGMGDGEEGRGKREEGGGSPPRASPPSGGAYATPPPGGGARTPRCGGGGRQGGSPPHPPSLLFPVPRSPLPVPHPPSPIPHPPSLPLLPIFPHS
jgi:NAD+ synthase (glutamine-hydrolysing)